ncbi:MAG: tetratricopeptide repeat protein [Gemmatimonadota bacterium]|nr:MAG: tetratricopeptide repeat protein [Gemmatimonadota bacterium]
MSRFRRLILELHRRSLWQVMLIYVGGAWAGYEIIDAITDRLALPAWLPVLAIILFVLGLPFVLATAFVREEQPPPVREAPEAGETTVDEELRAAARREAAGRRRILTWRSAGLAFVGACAVWGIVAAGWFALQGLRGDNEDAAPTVSTARVAVLPFSVRGRDELAYLSEGMVDLLSTALDGAGELRAVDPYALLKHLAQEPTEPLDPEAGGTIARHFGAGLYVLGSVVEAGGQLQVNASLYDADGAVRNSAREIAGDESQVFDLVNNVARQLLAGGVGGSASRLTRVAAATTESWPALKGFLEGESLLRAGRFGEAVTAFQGAIEADSTFALAWYRLGLAVLYSPEPVDVVSLDAAEQAVRHSARLAPRDRDRLAAFYAFLRGAAVEAESLAQNILSDYPEDMEAWYYIAETRFHNGVQLGRPVAEVSEPFRRALEYDPDHIMSLLHLSISASVEGRFQEAEQLIERIGKIEVLAPGGFYGEFNPPVLAFVRGGRSMVLELLPEMENYVPFSLYWVAFRIALLQDGLPAAIDVAGLLTEPSRSVGDREFGYDLQAMYEMARGRRLAAGVRLAQSEALGPVVRFYSGLEIRAALWLSPFLAVPRDELEGLRQALADLDYDTVWAPISRDYFLGLVSARLGEPAEAIGYATRLEARAERLLADEDSARASVNRDFALTVRAQVAALDGDPGEALMLLERTRPEGRSRFLPWSPLFSGAHERFLRAEVLESLGRDEEAIKWYASLGLMPAEVFFLAPAHLRRAEIYERLDRPEEAAIHYKRFIDLWRECDPELRPEVARAEAALRRLSGELAGP